MAIRRPGLSALLWRDRGRSTGGCWDVPASVHHMEGHLFQRVLEGMPTGISFVALLVSKRFLHRINQRDLALSVQLPASIDDHAV